MNVLVLGGGPGAEHDVSVAGSRCVAEALKRQGVSVNHQLITTLGADELSLLRGDVIFPVLHGVWGEGGPLQDLLARDGRPYVGSAPGAARLAMDKVATKAIATSLGVPTSVTCALNPLDDICPLPLPVVVKPVHEGSTIGLFVCKTAAQWREAHRSSAGAAAPCMIEPYVQGRELTLALLDGQSLPIIEIAPAQGLYDYDAKYTRSDTRFTLNPQLPPGVSQRLITDSKKLAHAIDVRHICRADFIMDAQAVPWLLEINTMPGFTDHSLVPMAAAAIPGSPLDMPSLCAALVRCALRDNPLTSQRPTCSPDIARIT